MQTVMVLFDRYNLAVYGDILNKSKFYYISFCKGDTVFPEIESVRHQKLKQTITKSDVWLTVHRNSVWIRKTN